jgi:hypothetical protein
MFASSAGVYLALFEVKVGLAFGVMPSSFMNPLVLCLAGRRLLVEETVPRSSLLRYLFYVWSLYKLQHESR